MRGSRFEVAEQYTLIKAVGKAYGVVLVPDTRTGRKVAIKKVGEAFNDDTDAKRTLREIAVRFLNHDNIIALVDIQPPRRAASSATCTRSRS